MGERLSRNAVPSHYDLHFEPDVESRTARVRQRIELTLARSTSTIELHAVELDVRKVSARVGRKRIAGSAKLRPKSQTVLLRFEAKLPKGPLRLDLDVVAPLRKTLAGLYLARRGDDDFVVTQFEPTDARAAFVCFDEPDAKASFTVHATVPEQWTAVSNGLETKRTSRARGRVQVDFARTRPLPPYLVALCCGPWEATATRLVNGIPVRVLTPPGRRRLAATALRIACAAQEELERYFDLPYPFDSCDHLAVPEFAAGAMENAGCITYRETLLLVDPATVSVHQLRDMANVITHELAHQWFGNLVTPKWWSDLWLNESFATWMAERILDQLYPEWEVWTSFENSKAPAFHLDALDTTHAIRNESQSIAEIMQTFDAITYQKGAAVLRMVENYLGPDVMREGIRLYIRRHADGNASGEDLWAALGEAAGQDVGQLLERWITRPGFPLVSLKRRGRKVELSQERFFSNPKKRGRKSERWRVPVVLSGPAGRERTVLSAASVTVDAPGRSSDRIFANGGAGGFYRTAHDRGSLARLTRDFPELEPAERAALLGDTWALTRADRANIGSVLDLIDRLGDEANPVVLGRGLGILKTLQDGFVPEASREAFEGWCDEVFRARIRQLGWGGAAQKEPDSVRLARAVVVDALGEVARADDAAERAREAAASCLRAPKRFDPELLPVVLRIAARRGDRALFKQVEARRMKASTPQLERTFMLTRCDFSLPDLHQEMLESTLTETVRSQDIASVIVRMLSNPTAREATWTFLRERFDEIDERAIWFMWKRIVDALPVLGTRQALEEMRAWFRARPMPDTDQSVAQALEFMELDLDFRERVRPQLSRWLTKRTAR